MHWNLGRGKYGQVEETFDTSWSEFVDFLRDAAQVPRTADEKEAHWWYSPMILRAGSPTRQMTDVIGVGAFAAFDVDHGNVSLDQIKLRLFGHPIVAYTTTQSRPDDSRWRICLQLDRGMSINEHARLWRYYADRLDLDPSTKNTNRIFYLPAQWHGADNVFYVEHGRPVHVGSILAMSPEIVPATSRHADPAYVPQYRSRPEDQAVFSDHMLLDVASAPVGGRLRRLLCASAKWHRLSGWDLPVTELANAASAACDVFSPGKKRGDMVRQAERAIAWADSMGFKPQTAIEKMRSRILWERTRK